MTAKPAYDLAMNSHQLMEWVLEPAADIVWDSAGTIITAEGHRELAPGTDAGWDKVVRAGAVLREAGNLLMLPGRAAGADWLEYSQALSGAGRRVMAAANAQDPDALFDAGGHVYQICRACHDQYWVRDED
ncbi:MAG: cytochrome c [Halioglobus sp.]|nr:cytochrome c [Halioglobus sp.]